MCNRCGQDVDPDEDDEYYDLDEDFEDDDDYDPDLDDDDEGGNDDDLLDEAPEDRILEREGGDA